MNRGRGGGASPLHGLTPTSLHRRRERRPPTAVRHSVSALRLAVGAIFLAFGLLKYFPGVSPAERLATDTTDVLFLGLVPPDNRANPTLVASMADELAGRIRRASRCSCGASGTARPLLGPSVRWTRLMAQRSVALKRHLSRSLYKRLIHRALDLIEASTAESGSGEVARSDDCYRRQAILVPLDLDPRPLDAQPSALSAWPSAIVTGLNGVS